MEIRAVAEIQKHASPIHQDRAGRVISLPSRGLDRGGRARPRQPEDHMGKPPSKNFVATLQSGASHLEIRSFATGDARPRRAR